MDRHHPPSRLGTALILSLLAANFEAHAQCAKPNVPAGGLPVSVTTNHLVTYSDGYRTRGDFLVPNAPTPSCGWPLVIFVHGLGANRAADRIEQWGIAMNGYAVWAYDVRGQGDAATLNPTTQGNTFDGPTEKYDLAEQIAFARASFANVLDPNLVAVTGFSQGGIHSWSAAALSGRGISAPGRPFSNFPVIAAVAPRGFVAEPIEVRVQDGTLFERRFVDYVATSTGSSVLDPAIRALAQNTFLADSPASLNLAFQLDPLRAILHLLPQTIVPILWGHALHDEIHGPQSGLDALAKLPASTPWRAMIGGVGHGAPDNDQQWEAWNELRVRWFDRFLWRVPNGVDQEARVSTYQPPLDPVLFRTPTSLWTPRADLAWPPADTVPVRLYTHGGGGLDPFPPGSAGTPTTITNAPQAGFTQASYLANWNERQTPTVLARIPLSERVFRTVPLPQDLELAGPVRVHLAFVPNAPTVQLAALLRVHAPGAAAPMTIAVHGKATRSATPNQGTHFEFQLGPAVTNLPTGCVLELVVRNHWLREAPWLQELVSAPIFTPYAAALQHGSGPTDATWVEVSVRTQHGIGLVSRTVATPAHAPSALLFEVRGGYTRGGSVYVIAGTLAGHDPLGPLPIRVDPLTDALLAVVNTPFAPGFLGNLDGFGNAGAGLDLPRIAPLPVQLAGERLSFTALVLDPHLARGFAASAPLDVRLR